jgi:Flp pilus assembly protein TadD
LTINPYDSGTRANLGRLLAGEGDWKQAIFHLQKAVQLDPENANAHGDLAVALLQLQRLPEAELEAKAAVTSDPESARAHDLLGQVFAERGKMTPARTEFETALKLDPEFAPAQLDLAESLIEQGHSSMAATLLKQAESSRQPDLAQRARAMLQQLTP